MAFSQGLGDERRPLLERADCCCLIYCRCHYLRRPKYYLAKEGRSEGRRTAQRLRVCWVMRPG